MLFLWVRAGLTTNLSGLILPVQQADFGVRCSRVLHAGAALFTRLVGAHHVGVDLLVDAARFVHAGGVDLKPAFGVIPLHKGRAAHVGDLCDRLFGGQAVGDFDNRALGVAVQQQVALGVHHDGAAHFVAPVVVMRDAAQRAFDAAQNDGHVVLRFAAALAVDNGGAVGALAADVAGGVGVVAADFAVRRVAVDHGVHVARRHAPEQIGFAQRLERLGALPVGLGDDADAKTLVFQHAANHRHAKAGVVDIGVAGDQNDVAAVPAQRGHFGAAHRQKFGRAKAGRPVLSVTGQRLGGAREEGDVDWGVHVGMVQTDLG